MFFGIEYWNRLPVVSKRVLHFIIFFVFGCNFHKGFTLVPTNVGMTLASIVKTTSILCHCWEPLLSSFFCSNKWHLKGLPLAHATSHMELRLMTITLSINLWSIWCWLWLVFPFLPLELRVNYYFCGRCPLETKQWPWKWGIKLAMLKWWVLSQPDLWLLSNDKMLWPTTQCGTLVPA